MKKKFFSKRNIIVVFVTLYLFIMCLSSVLLATKNNYGMTEVGSNIYISAINVDNNYEYHNGDLINIEKKEIEDFKVGEEIFLFRETDTKKVDIICSSVQTVNLNDKYVVLKNDSSHWDNRNIIGGVKKVYPKIGYIFSTLSSGWLFYLLLFIPAFLMFIHEIYVLVDEFKLNKNNTLDNTVVDNTTVDNTPIDNKNDDIEENTSNMESSDNETGAKVVEDFSNSVMNTDDNKVDAADVGAQPTIIVPDINLSDVELENGNVGDLVEQKLSSITFNDVVKDDSPQQPKNTEQENSEEDGENTEEEGTNKSKNNASEPIIIGKGIKNFVLKILELKKYEIFDIINILNNARGNEEIPSKVLKNIISSYVMDKYIQPVDYNEEDFKNRKKILIDKINSYPARKRNLDAKQKQEIINLMLFYNDLNEGYSNLDKKIDKFIKFDSDDDKKIIVGCIMDKAKNYQKLTKTFVEKIASTKVFKLILTDTVIKNVFNTQIKSNIKFSKIFSDYVIDKSYSQSVVLENLQEVLLKLVGSVMIKELFEFDYDKKYIIHFNDTLYGKERKINNFIDNFDDPFSQKKILILIDEDSISKHKNTLNKLKNKGFSFIVQINKSTLMNVEFDKNILSIGEYIFIIGDMAQNEIKSLIPGSMVNSTYCIEEAVKSEVIKK